METDNNNNTSSPVVCFICHTFFANPSCENMCSSCYKSAGVAIHAAPVHLTQKVCTSDVDGGGNPLYPKKSVDKNGCWSCKKKVAFAKQLSNKCKCGRVFCDQHRQAEAHDCEFNYKVEGRDRIEKANPLVRADKINRI
jgi:hypothetical protein